MSLTAPTIIMTLAIADCVHIVVTALRERRNGRSKRDAIVESLRLNFLPVFLTSLTTAIGFLSLNWIKVPPIAHLGNITAVGVTLAFVFSVTTLPALLSVLPLKPPRERARKTSFFERWAAFIIANRTAALWGSAVVVVGLASLIPSNELNDRFTEYFDETIRFRVENDFIAENLTSAYQIEYSLGAKGSGGVQEPQYLESVERFAQWWKENPQVSHVATITDVMKRLNMNMHGDDSAFYRLPDNRELAAQYLLLYEMSLPYGLDLNNQINVDKSASRFVVTLAGNVSAKDLRDISRAGEQWLVHNAPTHMQASASSPPIMFAYISQIALNNMLVGTTLALILVSSVILIALRSFRIGMLSLIPNLVPVGIGFGVWALINGEINMGMAPVVGMTLGIVVDDTIHFLSKYLRGRREIGLQAPEAVSYAFRTVGPAMVITTVTLVLGFVILSLSSFSVNSDMALMTAITIAAALVADFILLPALLLKADSAPALEFDRASTGRQGTPATVAVQVEN
ncbi:MAG TPA: MMPL family transporter, partial [candidate division Zixibacteria bacterium]|nr:MMPL family transporter [candidate division Zixibacteria bacterium]